jgi:hypothetical protein
MAAPPGIEWTPGRQIMRKLIAFALVIGVAAACSGRSKRTAFVLEPDPSTGGSLGAEAGQANDGGRSSASGGRTSSASGGSDGGAARGGNDGSGGRIGAAGEAASAGTTASGASGGRSGEGASAGTATMSGGNAPVAGSTSVAGGAGTGAAGSAGGPPVTTCNEEFGFLGTWQGSVLDFFFEPMQSVTLVFGQDEKARIYGQMTFGEGKLPPDPVDGDTPYPPGYWQDSWQMGGREQAEPWPGYPYSVVRGAGRDATLRFGIATTELWDEWCGMMKPVYTPDYGWGCTIQGGASLSETECVVQVSGQNTPYPTWKCLACGIGGQKTCACDEAGCFSNPEPNMLFGFTLSESEGRAVLTAPDYNCGDCTIRLTRTE